MNIVLNVICIHIMLHMAPQWLVHAQSCVNATIKFVAGPYCVHVVASTVTLNVTMMFELICMYFVFGRSFHDMPQSVDVRVCHGVGLSWSLSPNVCSHGQSLICASHVLVVFRICFEYI